MPRKALVDKETLLNILLSEKNEITDNEGNVKPPTSDVWNRLSTRTERKYTSKHLYMLVKLNRYNLWKELNICSQVHDIESPVSSQTDNSSDTSSEVSGAELQFTILLSDDEWKHIRPKDVSYKSVDLDRPDRMSRRYSVLNPGIWTSIINSHFWKLTSLRCTLSFKRAKVYKNSTVFVTMSGKCSECDSQIKGVIDDEPDDACGVQILCKYKGNFNTCTSQKKRKLSGFMREKAVEALCSRGISASAFKKLEAHKMMKFGDFEPSHLTSSNTLRVMKCRELKKSYIHEDPLIAIHQMMYDSNFKGAIKAIGHDPFHVHYWLPSQVHVYRAYCKDTPVSKVSIDATGGVVNKLQRPHGNKSGHIFLYEITVNDAFTHCQYAVSNMLSESHNVISISNWLWAWKKDTATAPKEIVCDHSIALLSAVIRVFTDFPNIEEYMKVCASVILQSNHVEFTKTLIRCDIAHTIKIICSWSILRGKNFRTRIFYIRSIAQIVMATCINDIKDLFESVFFVAFSETEGSDIKTGAPTHCEEAKSRLKRRIATGLSEWDETINTCAENSEVCELSSISDERPDAKENECESFSDWVRSIGEKCLEKVQSEEGDHDNLQHLPDIFDVCVRFSKLLPLWSSVMTPVFGYGAPTASSTSVESSFNDLKQRVFAHRKLPIRVDLFISEHISSLEGTLKLAEAARKGLSVSATEIALTSSGFPEGNHRASCDTTREKTVVHNPCAACSRGEKPTGAHKCVKCNTDVHIIYNCSFPLQNASEGYGESRLCYLCNSKSKLACRPEEDTLENWRGLVQPKKRARHSYLEPQSEFNNIDFSCKRNSNPIGILKNGNRYLDLQGSFVDKKRVVVTNTCVFDSIVQVLACAYTDSREYMTKLKSLPENALFQVVKHVAVAGITAKTYSLRANILLAFCEIHHLPNGVDQICAESTAAKMAENILAGHPSVIEKIFCSNCLCTKIISRTVLFQLIQVEDIGNLKQNIESSFEREETRCLHKCTRNAVCQGMKRSSFTFSDKHILIELLNLPTKHTNQDVQDTVLPLDKIPVEIVLYDRAFHLRGVVSFKGNSDSINSIGHYTAVCRRPNGRWEIYNDLSDKKSSIATNKRTPCQMLIYTI